MSVYTAPYTIVFEIGEELKRLYAGRTAIYGQPDASGNTTLTITPDVPVAADDIVAVMKANTPIDPTRYVAVKTDLSTLRTYVGLANPTTAQTTAAVKSLIRVLRAVLAD
jgi:hypothetical protein